MYSMLNAQMIQASHADRSQDALMAGHLRELASFAGRPRVAGISVASPPPPPRSC